MVKINQILLSIFAILSNINSIYLHTKKNKNEYCMSKFIDVDDSITISYLITGDSDEEKIDSKFVGPEGSLIGEKTNESGGLMKFVAKQKGEHKLCFFVPKPGENFISFEFFTANEKGHTLDMAKDGNQLRIIILFEFF